MTALNPGAIAALDQIAAASRDDVNLPERVAALMRGEYRARIPAVTIVRRFLDLLTAGHIQTCRHVNPDLGDATATHWSPSTPDALRCGTCQTDASNELSHEEQDTCDGCGQDSFPLTLLESLLPVVALVVDLGPDRSPLRVPPALIRFRLCPDCDREAEI